MATDFEFSPFSLDWTGDFDVQVKNVLDNVRLTRTEVDDLSGLFSDLQNTLRTIWHGCQVMPFGSIITGLGIRSSDVDCFVHIPGRHEHNQAKLVITARNVLRKNQWIFQQLFAVTTAKVPIVKLFHVPTGRHCDVNFKSPSGVRNSNIIAFLLQMDKRALPLAILIKYWSKVHKLTGTNLLSNYSLTMMIIFYMQYKNILPSVSLLQRIVNGTFIVDDWNTAFSENYRHQTDNTESLYELIGGFFQFYSTYKYGEFIISTFTGTSIPRRLFKDIKHVPNDFDLYKRLVSDGFEPLKVDRPMCVQDVFEHNRNCTGAVFPRLVTRLTLHLQLAAKIYSDCSSKDFLQEILVKRPDIPKPIKRPRPIKTNNTNNEPNPAKNKEPQVKPNLKRPNLQTLYMIGRNSKKARNGNRL